MSWWRRWANRLGTPLFVAGSIAGCWKLLQPHSPESGPQEAERPAAGPVTVTASPVTPRPVQRTVAVVGSLYGRDEITVAPKVAGRIVRIYKDVGEPVRPGDVLMELDPTDYKLTVAEAQRSLQLELAKLGLTALPDGKFDPNVLPTVVKASARQRDAAAHHQRAAELMSRGVSSATDRDAADRDLQVARAEYNQSLLDANTTLATARLRQAALDTALQQLNETRVCVPGAPAPQVKAPGAPLPSREYVVTRREVSEGEYLHTGPGSSVIPFRLVVDRPLKLLVTVPERHKGEIAVGQAVRLKVESHPGETFQGTVARVNPSVDRASRTFQVEAHVPNDDRRLSPGSFVKAEILTRTDPAAPTVPEEAVVSFAGVTKVFVVADGRVREVPVRPGPAVPGADPAGRRTWVEVSGALPPKAAVVTTGHALLADGVEVRVRDERTPAGGSQGGRP